MEQLKKVYLVDSENVGDLWVTHIFALAVPEDEIVVFYTQKSPHMGYDTIRKLLEDGRKVQFIKCVEGKNALDFQLVTELGYRLGSQKEPCEYIIVTNDTGFDAVVQYWKEAEKPVRRFNARYCQNQYNRIMAEAKRAKVQAEAVPEEQVTDEHTSDVLLEHTEIQEAEKVSLHDEEKHKHHQTSIDADEKAVSAADMEDIVAEADSQQTVAFREKAAEQPEEKSDAEPSKSEANTPGVDTVIGQADQEHPLEKKDKESDEDTELIKELVSCLGVANSGEIHNALTMFLGNDGKQVYQQVKGNLKDFVSGKDLKEKDKFKTYCQLVFERSEKKESCPKNFSNFVYGAKDKRKNLNSFRAALQKEYGKEKGMQYYSLIKPHVKILNKIQK